MQRGTSILEVVIAIVIVAIGILGAVAVFVTASGTMRKGRIVDEAAAGARDAVSEFDTRGMRRPDRWYVWNGSAFLPNQMLAQVPYCIDNRFLAANVGTNPQAGVFPFNHTLNPVGPRMSRLAFIGSPTPYAGPTVANTLDTHKLLGDSYFVIEEPIADRDEDDRSQPAMARYDYNGGKATKRAQHQHLSWFATLCPKLNAYNGMLTDEFNLSVVVVYDRDLGYDGASECVANVTFTDGTNPTDGVTGGLMLLSWPAAQTEDNDALAKKRLGIGANEWVMLSGLQGGVIPRIQWYRVSHCEQPIYNGAAYQSFVTLIGPDWNTALTSPQATFIPGVVVVHEKTVRLEYGDSL